ncbi:ribonuclease T2 family protein [Paludibaculum fermentans]|uniref:Ribonuclease T2 n=1 Tax=Paludibaculum fermentans TaxID=1473598 RepID=A0A7S7NR96_PALFE|nr:ribonuclease T2 [Paludibaculum fermentans]QOY88303.1 ribonuclease T2 [Paludibaculum fermentans]
MKHLLCLGLLAVSVLSGAERDKKIGEPGQFDYYLMTMSWSPAYCAGKTTRPNDPQCGTGRSFSFVLHGLWPQYTQPKNGSGWPQFCTTDKGLSDPKTMLDIMPSLSLINHEWTRHGTCSGMNADNYFKTARKALQSIKVPARFQAPKEYFTISPVEVKKEFLQANPGLTAGMIAISCSANFLSEVRVCLDKNLKPIPCTGQRECKASSVRVPPVR